MEPYGENLDHERNAEVKMEKKKERHGKKINEQGKMRKKRQLMKSRKERERQGETEREKEREREREREREKEKHIRKIVS